MLYNNKNTIKHKANIKTPGHKDKTQGTIEKEGKKYCLLGRNESQGIKVHFTV